MLSLSTQPVDNDNYQHNDSHKLYIYNSYLAVSNMNTTSSYTVWDITPNLNYVFI